MNAIAAINAYSNVGLESSVAGASPHKLISMLYDGALLAISNAKMHVELGNTAARGASISHAISIINDGLKVGINFEAGGELAQNLWALYEYMTYRLVQANLKADRAALDEVEGLLKDIKGAWDTIGNLSLVKPAAAEPAPPRVAASYGKA
jgi:flagellar protein FliS